MTLELRPYQIEGRDFLASKRHALLGDEMRVGKTPQAILAAHKAGAKSLFVVTRAVGVPQWEREIVRWWPGETLPRYKVLSFERATMLFKSGLKGAVDVFIPDECHFAKNPEAQRTKMVYGKGGFAWNAGATWALSGTPAPKHAAELWPMLRAFGVVGMTYNEFIGRYCTTDATFRPTGTKKAMAPELNALLRKIMLRRTRKQVAPDMPDISYQFLETDIQADMKVPADLSDDALLGWLEANRTVDVEDRIAVAMAKVPALAEHIEDAVANSLLRQTVVFGYHKAPLLELAKRLYGAGLCTGVINGDTSSAERERIQQSFREGRVQVICANIHAAGTNIDLSAASHGYFLEVWFVPGDNVQAANRLVSMDKQEPVTFDVVTAPGTTDERVQKILLRRAQEIAMLY